MLYIFLKIPKPVIYNLFNSLKCARSKKYGFKFRLYCKRKNAAASM